MVKVCIFGAGAIGGYIAAHLARSGDCDVSVVARGGVKQAIASNGLTVETPAGRVLARPRVTDDPATLGPQDYVLLTLKGHQLDAALPMLAPLIGPATAILPPTTGLPAAFLHGIDGRFAGMPLRGVDSSGAQLRAMPAEQTLGIVYWIGAHSEGPGIVRQDGPRASCMIGELDGRVSDRATVLSDVLTRAGISAPVRPTIRSDIWIKFVNSLCWNPLAVLTGATNGAIHDDRRAFATLRTMIEEADAIAAALGIAVPVAPDKRITVTASAPVHKMSMLQDLEDGRTLEMDVLEGSLRAVRELVGLPTPTLDAVLSLVSLRARTAHATGE